MVTYMAVAPLLLGTGLYVFLRYAERLETIARIDPTYAKELLPKLAIAAAAVLVVLILATLACSALLNGFFAWLIAIPYLLILLCVELVLVLLGRNVLNFAYPHAS